MFIYYLQKLLYAQSRSFEPGLAKDYCIIYEYLMDILEKDHVVGPFLVRRKQKFAKMDADILLDFTKFNIRSFVREPFLCLTLQTRHSTHHLQRPHPFASTTVGSMPRNDSKCLLPGLDNSETPQNHVPWLQQPHPFFNENLSLISYRITQGIWNALNNGFSKIGSFVRGHQDDIYELNLSTQKLSDHYVNVYANSENISLKLNIRILIKHTKNYQNEPKPNPAHVLKREWLAMVPLRRHSLFDICMPLLEKEMYTEYFLIIMLQRLLKHIFHEKQHLYHLNRCFLEAAINGEYLENVRDKKEKVKIAYIFKGVIIRIQHRFKNNRFPNVFNTNLNLINILEKDYVQRQIFQEINEIRQQTEKMCYNKNLSYEDFQNYLELKLEPDKYQVDQFGIWKSF